MCTPILSNVVNFGTQVHHTILLRFLAGAKKSGAPSPSPGHPGPSKYGQISNISKYSHVVHQSIRNLMPVKILSLSQIWGLLSLFGQKRPKIAQNRHKQTKQKQHIAMLYTIGNHFGSDHGFGMQGDN